MTDRKTRSTRSFSSDGIKLLNTDVNTSLTFGTGVLHLIQINHQPDETVFQFIILTSVYSSTCFGRFLAHHQEINDCSGSL